MLVTTANLRIKILDFRGLDSNIILNLRVGILMSIGDIPNNLNQTILVGIMLVGRLGVSGACHYGQPPYKDPGFQRVGFKHNLKFKGWSPQAHREFSGKFESSNLSREILNG